MNALPALYIPTSFPLNGLQLYRRISIKPGEKKYVEGGKTKCKIKRVEYREMIEWGW